MPPLARVRVPQARGWARPRLNAALERVGPGRPALVLAPAGCGKTTLLAQWVRARPGTAAWYRAEAADAEGGVGACLARALEVAGVPIPPATAAIEDVVAAVEAFGSPITLVLDDVHELRDSPAVPEIEQLLLLAPPNLTLALSGRVQPRLNFARSELSGPVQLTGDDLRFRSWEVEELFRDFHREPLRPDDAAALARRTGGWAAALQLFHLATSGRAPAGRSRAVQSLAAPARYAKDYLTAQVLIGLPVRLQLLLRRTCMLDVVTAARCEALLGSGTAQQDLDELVTRQALTTTDDGGGTFRYHEVLRSHLEGALREELGAEGAAEWYRRAADVLEAEGDVHGALRIRCRGGDWDGVRQLLRGNGEELASHASAEWTALLPTGLARDDPWVLLAIARRLLDEGKFAAAAVTARDAQRQLDQPSGRELCREVVRIASAWTGAPHLASPTWADMLRAATQRNPRDWAERARRELDSPMAELVAGIASLIAGDRRQGLALLERSAGAASPRVELAARLVLAAASPDGVAALDAVAAEAEQQGAQWLARAAVALARATAENAQPGPPDVATAADPWTALALRLALLLFRARPGSTTVADLDDLATACRALSAGALEAWPRAMRAVLLAGEGGPDSDVEARSAEAFARAAGVPGAQAIAYAALSIARGVEGAELRELAETTSEAAGFDLQRWVPVAAPPPTAPPAPPVVAAAAGPEPAAVELECFGPFRLRVDGVERSLAQTRPRARSLLRLLALHAEQPVHRERLTDLLWSGLDGEAATHNLHVALSSLRRILSDTEGAGLTIAREGDAYRLMLGARCRSDVQQFTAALRDAQQADDTVARTAALRRAVQLYRGDLLPEEGAAEWVLGAREEYRLLAVGAAAELAELELASGHADAAVAAARRGVQIDRYDDRCWRALVAAHRVHGDIATALQAERDYRAVLRDLGVDEDYERARNSSSPRAASGPAAGR